MPKVTLLSIRSLKPVDEPTRRHVLCRTSEGNLHQWKKIKFFQKRKFFNLILKTDSLVEI